jgi:DNA-binding SARP family transcriptional activator/energy-coupling factor transporter ATP-binding protein EcfA2
LEREPISCEDDVRLDVRLFGQADIRHAGAPVKFAKRSTTLTMLALLVLKRGQAVARDSLAFTLFPETDEGGALAELRRYLYLANRALPATGGEPWFVSDAETVRWNDAAGAFVDVFEFERLAAISETEPQAVALYAGDLLENVYEDWVVAERERLRGIYLGALDDLIGRYRAERNYAEAIACAKRILTDDAWREDTLRVLMALRYEMGDTAGALAEYERFAKRLRDELAVTPMPETVAVRQSILRQEAVPGAVRPSSGAPVAEIRRGAAAILPFVGRTEELAILYGAWSRAARGAAGFVVIAGEAGVGKTRLAAELARIVQSEGGRVFVGTTAAPESMPYQPIVEALRSGLPLLLARNISPERRTVLAPLLPELRDPDVPEVVFSETSPERATARIYEALSFAIRTLASPRPLLLVLEDLHWAGLATIEALGSILRDAMRSPILILATCRQEETPVAHPLRALERSLRDHFNVEELELERLDESDVGDLVERVEGLSGERDGLARSLYAQSEGNALFLDEAISAILENREPILGPATTSSVIGRRIERLGREGRSVVEIAAVAGSGCSVPLIRDVSNLSSAAIARGIDELLDHRILREAGARAGYDYVFSHHLIADAVYAEIEPAFREQRHHRVAECLQAIWESSGSGSAREIARHYESAAANAPAAEWYLRAAREAATVHAHGDAIELASRALQNAAENDLCRAALEVRETARSRRGDRRGQADDIDALEELAKNDLRARFDVLLRRVFLARALGDSDDEYRYIERLEDVAAELGDAERAQASTQAATHLSLCSRSAEAIEPARRALVVYERCGDLRGQLDCLYLLVEATANIGDLEAERGYLNAIAERAGSLSDRGVEARALGVAGLAALLRQDYTECFSLTERSLTRYIELNDREGEAASRARLAVTAAWLKDYTGGLHEFESAMRIYESLGHKRGLAVIYANRTLLLIRVGLFTEALRSIERSNELFERVQEKRTLVVNRVNASFVNLQLGNASQAKTLAASALATAREMAYPVFEAAALANLGNAERFAGEIDDAIEHMEAGMAIRRSVQEARDFVDDLADLTLAYVDAGRSDRALATARELLEIGAISFDGAFWPQYAWWAAAQGLAAGGAQDEAREAMVRSRRELEAFAERIGDEATRAAFLHVPINQSIANGAADAQRAG